MAKFIEANARLQATIVSRRALGDTVETISLGLGLPTGYVQKVVKTIPEPKESPRARKNRPLLKADMQKRLRTATGYYAAKQSDPCKKAYCSAEAIALQQIRSGRLTLAEAEQHLCALFQGMFEDYAKSKPAR